MIHRVHIKSSSSDSIYCITFTFYNSAITVHCDCPAGIYGKVCKHKTAILDGDVSSIDDSEINEDLIDLLARVKGNEDLINHNEELIEIEKQIKKMNTRKRKLKQDLEAMFKYGIEV